MQGPNVNKQRRPININPLSIRLPIMAIVSILHRISGVLVFLLIPMLLWALELSLVSPEGLAQIKDFWRLPLWKGFLWFFFMALVFHLFAGIRHLLMDIHIGDSHVAGRWGARMVMVATLVVMLVSALCMWR